MASQDVPDMMPTTFNFFPPQCVSACNLDASRTQPRRDAVATVDVLDILEGSFRIEGCYLYEQGGTGTQDIFSQPRF
jgi:hypothetical protein